MVRALENRTSPNTPSIGATLIRITPGIVVSKAFWAFPASDCNGWARLWGLAQGREWRRREVCRLVPAQRPYSGFVTCGFRRPDPRFPPLFSALPGPAEAQERGSGGRLFEAPPECARPRAQQLLQRVGSWNFPTRWTIRSMLRPGTGALRPKQASVAAVPSRCARGGIPLENRSDVRGRAC